MYYDRIYLSERINLSKGTDVAKINSSKNCIVCCYWFFNHGFKLQSSVCHGCHDLMMLCLNINYAAITIVKSVDYCCTTHDISMSEAIHLLQNSMLDDRGIYKMHISKISIKNQVCNCYFNNSIEAKN